MCALSSGGRRPASVPVRPGAIRVVVGRDARSGQDSVASRSATRSSTRYARLCRAYRVLERAAESVTAMGPGRSGRDGTLLAWEVSECREAAERDVDMKRAGPGVTDDALVRRALVGDDSAYGDLVRRHQAAALRVAAGICGSTEEARDIVQDAFVKGHRALRSWRGE